MTLPGGIDSTSRLDRQKPTIVCDIDGVLCDPVKWVEKCVPNNWKEYFSHTLEFKPIVPIIDLMYILHGYYSIHLVSGRPESNRELTLIWLGEHFTCWDALNLRKDGDPRPTYKIKLEWYSNIKPKLIFDDDPVLVRAAKNAGYLVVQPHGYRLLRAENIGDGIPFSTDFGHIEEV